MNIKIYLFFLLFGSLLIGCNNLSKPLSENPVIPSDSGVVNMPLTEGKGHILIQKKANETIYVRFEVKDFHKIHAALSSPDPAANIRFSQIFMPDGTMDGPFGRDMQYNLSLDGKYQISIHENMMAGDPWSGNVVVDIELLR